MSILLFGKAGLIWLAIAILAVGNGFVRESVLVPLLGSEAALPVSGISLSLIVLLVTWLTFGWIGEHSLAVYFLVGLQWVLMTLAFDFSLGYFVEGKSWSELMQIFNVADGNLFPLVLIVTLFAPYLIARFKGLV